MIVLLTLRSVMSAGATAVAQTFHMLRTIVIVSIARIFHEWPTATTDMGVLPRVLGCRTL